MHSRCRGQGSSPKASHQSRRCREDGGSVQSVGSETLEVTLFDWESQQWKNSLHTASSAGFLQPQSELLPFPEQLKRAPTPPLPKAFPQGERWNRKRMARTKRQKTVSQTGGFVSKEQPELDPRTCLAAALSATLAGPKASSQGPGGHSPRVVERSAQHLSPQPWEELPPELGDTQTPSVPPSRSQTAPETQRAAARVSGDALHQAGLRRALLPHNASLWASPKLGLDLDGASVELAQSLISLQRGCRGEAPLAPHPCAGDGTHRHGHCPDPGVPHGSCRRRPRGMREVPATPSPGQAQPLMLLPAAPGPRGWEQAPSQDPTSQMLRCFGPVRRRGRRVGREAGVERSGARLLALPARWRWARRHK